MTEGVSIVEIKQHLFDRLQAQDAEVQVEVKRNSLGWFSLRVVTTLFDAELPEREQKIDEILSSLGLSLASYPFYDYELLTPAEAQSTQPANFVQLPLWSEILMAPEPDEAISLDDEPPKRPFVVTFYSFKGGVGRTTALGLVAGILARNRRVVMIDLDLEAPGLSTMFPPSPTSPDEGRLGVLDYLHQRLLTPELNVPPIEDCIRQIELQARGQLYLIPTGEYDEGYIHRLADLDMRVFYRSEKNPIHQLLDDIKRVLEPDVILIDARTGFDPTGAVALFDLADLAMICFSPTDQSFKGLKWVVRAARKQYNYNGKPDLHFLLTPLPPASTSQQQAWIAKAEDWIENEWGLSSDLVTNESYNVVLYNPQIPVLSSFVNGVPTDLLGAYTPIFEVIDNNLPDIKTDTLINIPTAREAILKELNFQSGTAQDIDLKQIPAIFQKTEDFPEFLKPRTWLIRGAKGTGKTLLFRLFVEQAQSARELAPFHIDLNQVDFVAGHGTTALGGPLLGSEALRRYEQQAGEFAWSSFWLNYALLQLCHAYPELHSLPSLDRELLALAKQDHPSQAKIVTWMIQRAASPIASVQATDELRAINDCLSERNRRVWLFYDELDAGFGTTRPDHARRKRALEALFAWWLEHVRGLSRIIPKILLREDIWNKVDFTNKAHYAGHFLQLRWEEADLWRLVLRQALSSSSTLATLLDQQLNMSLKRLDKSDLNQLRQSLYPLWGERMGRGRKAYTYNWVRKRITDTQNDRFPRSLVELLKQAIKIEEGSTRANPYETVLRPRSLINALSDVSALRVDEVRNEYPEFNEELNKLKDERSPISADRLSEIWSKQGKDLNTLISDIIKAGIMREYQQEASRYAVAELYLYGLGMRRKGQR